MFRWIANWALLHSVTPEKQAERALGELRLELFQAEQRVLDAQMHADYYRARLVFLEAVIKNGIERVSDQRKDKQESPPSVRTGLRFTAEFWRDARPGRRHAVAMPSVAQAPEVEMRRRPKIHKLSELSADRHVARNGAMPQPSKSAASR